MPQTVREIIQESCTRINLVPRRQGIPGDIVENAFKLLKGVVDKYNKDNLLSWTQNSIILENKPLIHIYDYSDVLKGQYNLYFDNEDELNAYHLTEEDYVNNVWAVVKGKACYYTVLPHSGVYLWSFHQADDSQRYQEMKRYESMIHVQVRDVSKINSIYVINAANDPYREIVKLDFINHSDYDRYSNGSKVYTYTQKSEGEWLLEIKPFVSRLPYRLKMNYNEGFKFDLDSELYIPDNYIELLIVALAHKLALMYPRLDDAQMQRLQNEVSVLLDNVKTPNAVDRMIIREDYWDKPKRMTQDELMSGDWLFL